MVLVDRDLDSSSHTNDCLPTNDQRLFLLRLILRQSLIIRVVHLAGRVSFVLYGKVSGRGWFWFLLSLAARCVLQLLEHRALGAFFAQL